MYKESTNMAASLLLFHSSYLSLFKRGRRMSGVDMITHMAAVRKSSNVARFCTFYNFLWKMLDN